MARLSYFFLSALAVLGAQAASDVLELTPANFDDVVLKSGKPALVEFFAPWCGHCKNLAPVWEELATSFSHGKDKVTIAKVDADAHRDLGQRFGVQGFPTLKWFDGKSKTPEEYNSGRDIDALTTFITEKTSVKAKSKKTAVSKVTMLNDQSFGKSIGGDKNVLVAFTAPWCGHCKALKPTWETLAEDFEYEPNVLIAQVDAESPGSKATAESYGVTGFPTIKFFPKGSSTPEDYDGGRDESAFLQYINDKAGTYRAVGGGLTALGGLIPSLDDLVEKAIAAKDGLTGGLAGLKTAAQKEQGKYAQYYVKVAEKASANKEYLAKEFTRLEKIVTKGGLTPEKRDDVVSRKNIVEKIKSYFEPTIEAVKEKIEEGKSEL